MRDKAEHNGECRHSIAARCSCWVIVIWMIVAIFPTEAGVQCSLPDMPACACYLADCAPVACTWPFIGLLGNIAGTANRTVGTRSCCIKSGGTAYWQIQRQVSIPEAVEALAFENPNIQNEEATVPQAWCTETIAFWGFEASVPYAEGYYTGGAAGHHRSSYVKSGSEMRRWYEAEEIRAGVSRGRWICATELDYAAFEPGVNGPCPGAYQQIYGYDIADSDGNGNAWIDSTGHSQLIDSMVVYRLNAPDGPVQRIDIKMVEGNIGFGGGSIFSRIINTRWYRDIIDFTPLGTEYLDTNNRKIRGWGINLNADGTVRCDCDRIRTIIISNIMSFSPPSGPDNCDSVYVAAMANYFTMTGGNVVVTTNSTTVQTGGALPEETSYWTIPPPPHPEDPVCIEVDLLDQYPDRVEAITLEWLYEIPRQFEVRWAGADAVYKSRSVILPTPPPVVPTGTALPLTVMFTPAAPDTGHPVRYVQLCIPQSALTKTFYIRKFHYNYWSDEIEDNNGSSPEGDAGDPWTGFEINRTPSRELWLRSGFPNPFQTGTAVSFGLPESGYVRLAVYDVRGRRVRVLLSRIADAGTHTLQWDGRNERGSHCPSGVYFARLEWRGRTCTRKLILAR